MQKQGWKTPGFSSCARQIHTSGIHSSYPQEIHAIYSVLLVLLLSEICAVNRHDTSVRLVPNQEKEYVKAIYCHPAYLTYMQTTLCKMLGWMKHKLESRLLGEISITSDRQMTPPVWQKAKKNQRASDESKIGEWKSWSKTKIMVSGPITSWQINGETMEKVRDYLGWLQITADGDYSHEIKRHLLLGRKAITNLVRILKSVDTTFQQRSVWSKPWFSH